MNNNTLFLHILPAILNETLEVPINPAAGYNSPSFFETYDLLTQFPQNNNIATIAVMDIKPLYEGLLGYLYHFIEDKVPDNPPLAEIYFEIKETVTLGLYIRAYLYGTGDRGFEEDVTSLLLDLHGYITDEQLDWLLQDLFPDYHGKNPSDSLNPFYPIQES